MTHHLHFTTPRLAGLIATTAVVLLILLLPFATQPAQAAPITCSEAGLNSAITAATSGETLNFTADCLITLTSQVVINKDLTITGDGFTVIIDGNGATRVFDITAGTVVLDDLIIRNGYIAPAAGDDNENGANIRNAANLTVRNSAILNGDMAVGFFFPDNEGFGGGISTGDGSTLNVINTTIAGNTAQEGGGAIAVPSDLTATIIIANSTIINNSERSTVDGGGLSVPIPFDAGTFIPPVVKNSIIANNISIGFGLRNSFDVVNSQGYNISDDDLQGSLVAMGDRPNIDPDLGAVDANGVAVPNNNSSPVISSPAIDGGNPAGCTDHLMDAITQDQRGNNRADLRCDVGAVEFVSSDGDTIIKALPEGESVSFGPTMVQMTRAGGSTDTGVVSVRKVPNAPGVQESGEMPVHWLITPALNDSGLNLSLMLCYTAVELAAAPGASAGTLEMYRWVTNGSPWVPIGADSRPTVNGNGCVLKNGVTQLSWWTIASVEPTAVSLQAISTAVDTQTILIITSLLLTLMTLALIATRHYHQQKT